MLKCVPILVLRHEPFEHLGYFTQVLEAKGLPFVYHDLEQPFSLQEYSALIVMGGPQSANDAGSAFDAERRLILEGIKDGIAVLGICLGAQLIAKVLGSRIYKNPVHEIGWAPVHFTEEGQLDPLFASLPSPTTVFHWHGETFDLPEGAAWLAYSDECRHQAFRYGKNVYGIQFHPEITPEMILDWSAQPANCGDVEALAAPIDPHAFDTRALAKRALDAWLATSPLLP